MLRNNYIKKTLKNGVKLYLYLDKNMKKTYVSYFVNYGSSGKYFKFYYKNKYYEVLPGVAHFLEHMLGEHSKYGNFYKIFGSNGYEKNGLTSLERTEYYFIGVDNVLENIKILIDSIDNPTFTKEDVKETSYAIKEETKRGLNNKYNIVYGLGQRNLFNDIELFHESLTSIGNEETTLKLDYDTLKLCYDAFYYDENKVLVIAGNYDEKEITDYIESIYSKRDKKEKEVELLTYENLDDIRKKEDIYYMSTSDDLIEIAFKNKIDNYSNKEIFYYNYFMLYAKFNSYLPFIDNLKENDIITSLSYDRANYYLDNYVGFSIMSSVKVNKKDIYINKVLDELKNNNYTSKDFELFKKDLISNQILNYDYKYIVFKSFAHNYLHSDNFDEIDYIKNLKFEDFIKYYNSLSFDNYTISIVRKEK